MLGGTDTGGAYPSLELPRYDEVSLTGALAYGSAEFLMKYTLLPQPARVVLPLWVMSTHTYEDYDWVSYLNITSPEPGSGKTTTGDILGALCCRGTRPLYGTMAAIRDYIGANKPVLVLDEWDAMPSDMRRLYTAILNSGTRADGCYWYKSGGMAISMSTFCPKIIIGRTTVSLPGATLSRCIPILLHRAKPGEVEPFNETARQEAARLKESLTEWAEEFRRRDVTVEPDYPAALTEPRQRDIAKPLLVIADACRGQWPNAARKALVELLCDRRPPPPENQLLRLVKRYQLEMAKGQEYFRSEDFCAWANIQEDRPWPNEKLTRQKVNAVLSGIYQVRARERHKRPEKKFWAYRFADFAEVFERYL